MPRRDGPSAGPADDARRTPASPEGRGQESARPSAPADRGERLTGPSGERDASGGHGAHRPEAGEEAAALVSQHGPLTKAETWQAFKNTRDADYAGRFSKEERFAHATRDLDVDHEVASAERGFREADPELAAHLPADGTAAVSKGFREALHDAFSSAWKKSAGRPEETDAWSETYTRLRQELPDRFAQVSLQHREISRMDTALKDAADGFGEKDLFRGNYLPKEKFDENAVKFDEATGTFSVDHEKAGPYGKLQLDVHKDVVETVNSAWRDAGGLPTGEAARGLENDLGQIRDGLHERLENLSNQERQVQHGERALDEEHSARGTPLSRDVLDRVRKEFGDEIRSRYNELREQATGRDPGWFDRAWDAADEHMRGTDALRNRLDHGEFREKALQQGKQALRKAVARAQGEDGGEGLGEYVGPEGEERLTTDWTKAVEKAVDDHWSSLPGRDFRSTGRPQESVRSSVDDDAVSSRGSVGSGRDDVSSSSSDQSVWRSGNDDDASSSYSHEHEWLLGDDDAASSHGSVRSSEGDDGLRESGWRRLGDDDAGLHEGLQMSWEERFQQLSHTLPQRIAHESDKNIVLRGAANDFEQIAGHPDDLSAGHTVTPESFEKLSSDFRTDTVTEYDRLWGPEGTDSKAWLEHEAQHENVFETTLTGLREAPYRPGDRGPEGHAEESAAGGPADPRPPDDDTSGPAVPSSGDRPTPTAASADRPVPEPGARPAEHMGSDPGQVHAQVVRERPTSSSVRSPGSHEEGLGAKGAGETTPKPTGEHDLVETPESSVATPSEIVDGFTKTLNRVGETAAIRDDAYKTFQTQFEARYPELRTRPAVRDVTPVREWFADRWTAAAKEAGGSEHLTTATQERLKGELTSRLPTDTRPPADDRLQRRYEREFHIALRVEGGTDYANPDPTWDQTTTDLFHQRLDRLRERYVADRIPLGVNRTEQVEHLQQVIVKAATMLRARVEPIGATVHAFNERTRDMSPHAGRDQTLKGDPALFSWYRRQQADIVRRFSDALELHGPGAELERVFQQRITTLRDMAWSRLEASREFGRLLDKAAPQELATPAARTWAADQVEEVRERFVQAHIDWRATVTPPEARGSASASAETSGSVDSPVVADRAVAEEEPARVEEARSSASASAGASGSVAEEARGDDDYGLHKSGWRPLKDDDASSSYSQEHEWLLGDDSDSASAEATGSVDSPDVVDRVSTSEEQDRLVVMQRRVIRRQQKRVNKAIARAAANFAAGPHTLREFNVPDGAVSRSVLSVVRDRVQSGFDDVIARETSPRKTLFYPGPESVDVRIADLKARISGPVDRLVKGIGWALEREAAREATIARARAMVDTAAWTWQTVLEQSTALRNRLGVQRPVPADVFGAIREGFAIRAGARFDSVFDRASESRTTPVGQSHEQLEKLLNADKSRLHDWFLLPIAHRALVAEAIRMFDERFDTTDAGRELAPWPVGRLRNAFAALAGEVFESVFDSVTADPVDLTARIWEWEDRMNGLLGELAGLVGVESAATEEPRADTTSFHGLSDEYDVAQEELATGDRDDRASAGVVESPMHEPADLDAVRESLGERSAGEAEAPARGTDDAVESQIGTPAPADDAERAVSDLGEVPVLRELGAESSDYNLDVARELLEKEYEDSRARHNNAMLEARRIIRELVGRTPSISDPGGVVSDIDRARILTAAWIVRMGSEHAKEFADSALTLVPSREPMASEPEQFTRAGLMAKAAEAGEWLNGLADEAREKLLDRAGQIVADHHESPPVGGTVESLRQREAYEAVLQVVAHAMAKAALDGAGPEQAEAEADGLASWLADALGTRHRTGGAPPEGSQPPITLELPPAAGSAVTASTDGVDETVHDYADLNRARRALAKQSGSRYDDPMEKAWTIVRDRSGLRPTWNDLGGEVSDVDRIRLLVAAHIARERSDGHFRSDVDQRASEPVRSDHSGEVSDVDREAAPTVHDRSAEAFADFLLAALSASAPSRWTSDLTAEVNGILGRWRVPLSTSEEVLRAYHGLPDEDRKGPMRTVAQRIADRLVNGESLRLPGGAIGAEFESVIKLHADAELKYATLLADNERLGFKLVVDHRNFFIDTEGDYYPTAELFKASNKPLKERQDKTPIVEFVTRPGGIPGEHKKWTIKEIIAQVSTTINALAKAEEPLSIAEWLPESEGWTVHRPEIRGEVLPIRTGQADDVTLYAQYTVDLRPTELYGALQDVLAQGKQGTNSARFLQQGLEFGTEIARDFAALLTGTELPSSAVDVLDEIEPVAAVRGFLALVYPHITAIFRGALVGTNLIKNWVLAASRTDFAAIRGLLPEASRLFLEFYAPAIEKRLVEKFREGSPELDEQAAGANLLAKRLWSTDGTIGDYLNSALLEPQGKPVDQLTGIGMWTHNRRTHDGQLAVELRGWGPYPIGLGEVPEVIDSLGTMLADRENRAGRKRFQTSARGPRLLDAARLLADHPRAAAFRSFNEDGLGQLKRIWRKKHSKDGTELLPVADVATILVGLRALDVPEPTSAQDVADAIEVLQAASNRLKLIAADKSTAIQNMAHGALERLEAVLEPLHAYTPPSTGQEQADAGAFTADHSQISLDLWQVASLLSETSPEERVRVFGDFLMGLDATWRPRYPRGELFPVADVATVLRGLRSPHDEDVPLDIEDGEPLSRLRSHLETLADDPQVGDQAHETLQNLDALEAYFWSSNIVSSPDALGEIESGLEPDVAPSVPGSPSVGLDEFEFGLAPGSPSSVPVSPRELVASEPDPATLETLMNDAAQAERWLDELQDEVRDDLLARASGIVGLYHQPLPGDMTGERVEQPRPVYEAVLLVVATTLANPDTEQPEVYAHEMASWLAEELGTRRLPDVVIEDDEADISGFAAIAVRARVSAEELSAFLILRTERGEKPKLDQWREMAPEDLQGEIDADLRVLKRAAESLAPMGLDDIARVAVEWGIDLPELWIFGRELREIYSRTPDSPHASLESFRQEQVRKMFRAVPGARVDGDSIDVKSFLNVAGAAEVSADVLRAMLLFKGGDAAQELEDLEALELDQPAAFHQEVIDYLALLEGAAESLAMSANDVAWFSARTGVRPNDLKIFGREFREIYSQASDTGPSRAEPESSLTGEAIRRRVPEAEARLEAAARMLLTYASPEDIADFAAMAARLGTDAEGMRTVVEAARARNPVLGIADLRRVSPYDLLDLVVEDHGTQAERPSRATVNHRVWFEQAREIVDRLAEKESLLRLAGEIIAHHHEPLPVDMTTVTPEKRAAYEGILYAVAEQLHFVSGPDGSVDDELTPAIALSEQLADETGTGRRTGGAPPGSRRRPLNLVEIGGGGESSGLRAGMSLDRAGAVVPVEMGEGYDWRVSGYSKGPYCVQVALVGRGQLRGGRVRRR
ncbi:hypothetical protein NE236_10110 [Actinoallomurus purpureus]|nr:hypothetical protein [Actinoallomurus purpureus]